MVEITERSESDLNRVAFFGAFFFVAVFLFVTASTAGTCESGTEGKCCNNCECEDGFDHNAHNMKQVFWFVKWKTCDFFSKKTGGKFRMSRCCRP